MFPFFLSCRPNLTSICTKPLVVLVVSSSGSSYLLEHFGKVAFWLSSKTYKPFCDSRLCTHKDRKATAYATRGKSKNAFDPTFGTTVEPGFPNLKDPSAPESYCNFVLLCFGFVRVAFSSKASWTRGLANWIFL